MISRNTLTRFSKGLARRGETKALQAALSAWFHEVKRAEWRTPADVKKQYANASIVSRDRVVFNIKGNDYRLIAALDYTRQVVYIKWVGKHADYDQIDARSIQFRD